MRATFEGMKPVTVELLEDRLENCRQLLRQTLDLPSESPQRSESEHQLGEALGELVDELWWVITRSFRWWYTDMKGAEQWSLKQAFRRAANRNWITIPECEAWMERCNLYEDGSPGPGELDFDDIPKMLAEAKKLAEELKQDLAEEPVYFWRS